MPLFYTFRHYSNRQDGTAERFFFLNNFIKSIILNPLHCFFELNCKIISSELTLPESYCALFLLCFWRFVRIDHCLMKIIMTKECSLFKISNAINSYKIIFRGTNIEIEFSSGTNIESRDGPMLLTSNPNLAFRAAFPIFFWQLVKSKKKAPHSYMKKKKY